MRVMTNKSSNLVESTKHKIEITSSHCSYTTIIRSIALFIDGIQLIRNKWSISWVKPTIITINHQIFATIVIKMFTLPSLCFFCTYA